MGILTSVPEGGLNDDASTGEDTESLDSGAPDTEAAPAPVQKQEPVALPPKTPSRREQARLDREALESKIKTLEESSTKTVQELERKLREQAEQSQRMLLETIQKLTPQQQAIQAQQQKPDPTKLMDEAQAALDRGDLRTYNQKIIEAAEARILAQLPQPQQQQAPQPQMDPRLYAIMAANPKVANHARGMELAQIKDRELAVMGYQDGPERWQKAFELAEQTLFGGQARQQFTTPPGAVAGTPTNRTGAQRQAPTVVPPKGWERVVASGLMTKEEYLRDWAANHPESVNE